MANLLENNIQATAKESPEVFYNALESANTIEKGYFDVIPGVKNDSINLDKLTINAGLTKADLRDCSWDASEVGALGSKTVEVGNFKVNGEQCIDALDSLFAQERYKATKRGEVAPEFETLLLQRLGRAVGLDIENIIWTASKAGGDSVDGVLTEAAGDSEVIKVQGTTLNASNVLTEIEKVYAVIPQAVLDEQYANGADAQVSIHVGPTTMRFVRQALSTTPTNVNVTLPSWTIDNGEVYYLGIRVACAQGIPANKMFAGAKYNLKFVTNMLEDAELEAERGKSLRDKNVLLIRAQFKAKATYVNSDEVVLYE